MGGRGSGYLPAVERQVRKLAEQGQVPQSIPGTGHPQEWTQALEAIEKYYTLPPEIEAYMNGTFANGRPRVEITETEPGSLYIRWGNTTGRVTYPVGNDKARAGAIKWYALRRGAKDN